MTRTQANRIIGTWCNRCREEYTATVDDKNIGSSHLKLAFRVSLRMTANIRIAEPLVTAVQAKIVQLRMTREISCRKIRSFQLLFAKVWRKRSANMRYKASSACLCARRCILRSAWPCPALALTSNGIILVILVFALASCFAAAADLNACRAAGAAVAIATCRCPGGWFPCEPFITSTSVFNSTFAERLRDSCRLYQPCSCSCCLRYGSASGW